MHSDWHSRVRDAMVLTLGPGPQAARDHGGPGFESKSDSKLPAGSCCTGLGVRDSDTQAWTRILMSSNGKVTVLPVVEVRRTGTGKNASSFRIERTGPPGDGPVRVYPT